MSEQPTGLDLNQLPGLTPPRDVLPEVLAGRPASQPAALPRWPMLAAAAVAVCAAGIVLLLRQPPTADSGLDHLAGSGAEVTLTEGGGDPDTAIAYWINYSQQLEQQLRTVRSGTSVLHGHRAAAINLLQEDMALIDMALAQTREPAESLLLWQARTARLNDLVAVHAASASALSLNDDHDPALDPVMTLQPPLAAARVSLPL